jgi:hypothetical protein
MCGCTGIKGWVYVSADGANRYEYRTEVEAMAHYYRADGQGTVEPVKAPVNA